MQYMRYLVHTECSHPCLVKTIFTPLLETSMPVHCYPTVHSSWPLTSALPSASVFRKIHINRTMPHPHFCDPLSFVDLVCPRVAGVSALFFFGEGVAGYYFNVSVHSSLMSILVLSTLVVVSGGQDCIQCDSILLHYTISSSTCHKVVMGLPCPALCHERPARRMLNWFLISPAREYGNTLKLERGGGSWENGRGWQLARCRKP